MMLQQISNEANDSFLIDFILNIKHGDNDDNKLYL